MIFSVYALILFPNKELENLHAYTTTQYPYIYNHYPRSKIAAIITL